jgi:choline dehydrogenase
MVLTLTIEIISRERAAPGARLSEFGKTAPSGMSQKRAREDDAMKEKKDFDFIVIGAGAAGCLLASRLSKDPAVRVALIEAGPSDLDFPVSVKTTLPIGNVFLLPDARYNWQHVYSGGPEVNGRQIPCPRGKLLGGCTSVNGTVYMRGHPTDYDEWAALGNEGWGYQDVLAYYKRHENYVGQASGLHGSGGELDVRKPRESNRLAHALIEAAIEGGHQRNDDFNGARQDGFGIFDLNQRGGVRLSSSRAFLHPVVRRSNLRVFANTLVERINLQGSRVAGVTIRREGKKEALVASAEVVLAAGTINSPQLMMLSGLGPADMLRRHGIRVVEDLPGVGANLQDHPTVSVAMSNPGAESYALSWRTAPRIAAAPLRYLFARSGMLASNAAEAGGFLHSREGLTRPDLQMTFMVGLKDNPRTLPRRHGFVLHVAVLRPATRGLLELASADPAARPVINPHFLEDRADVDALIAGLKSARHILSMPAMARYSGAELSPGPGVKSDAELEAFIRANLATTYHPVGTCKMGPRQDPMAVVDSRLRVHGISGLRVADASIMPNIIGGNTSAPSMMIGERAAEFIVQDSNGSSEGASRKIPSGTAYA